VPEHPPATLEGAVPPRSASCAVTVTAGRHAEALPTNMFVGPLLSPCIVEPAEARQQVVHQLRWAGRY
jgi:hypothetical protein